MNTTSDHPKHTWCAVDPVEKEIDAGQLAQSKTIILLVQGMGCPTCALRVRNGLLRIDGVLVVDVVLSYGLAKVWYDPNRLQSETLPGLFLTFADDGQHHYTARILAHSEREFGGSYGTPI